MLTHSMWNNILKGTEYAEFVWSAEEYFSFDSKNNIRINKYKRIIDFYNLRNPVKK